MVGRAACQNGSVHRVPRYACQHGTGHPSVSINAASSNRAADQSRAPGTLAHVDEPLNYDAVGATRPGSATWESSPSGYRRYEHTVHLGDGQQHWEYASTEVLRWGIKTRSGFSVTTCNGVAAARAQADTNYTLNAHLGPITIREPVRVIAVVEDPDRCGFSYGTRNGHPVSGEEAFIVHRTTDGAVWLTLRSLTRPADGIWRALFPALLIAQRFYRRQYMKALIQAPN